MGFKVNRTGGMVIGAHNIGGDIPPSGTINITENGTYDVGQYASADVQTPVPSGKITITKNGSDIDVSDYALADVDVPVGLEVSESYDISEGTLNSASVELDGDVIATIPDGVVALESGAFYANLIINKVIMPNSVLTIGDGHPYPPNWGVFAECKNLKEVILSTQLTKIGDFCFYQCSNLNLINIPNGVITIGSAAFQNCENLTSIVIPDSVTSIGDNAFYECSSLTSIVIGNGVTSIGAGAFEYCENLTSIVIPDSVTSIGNSAFYECSSLTDIYYTGTQAEWNQITIGTDAIPQGVTIHYDYVPQ